MGRLGACNGIVPVSFAAAFLVTSSTAALAEGCTEQIALDFLAGWSNDLPKLMSIFADDVIYEDKTVPAVLHGKEELRGFAEGWFKASPDMTFTLAHALISGNGAAVEWKVTGTQKGDMPGMAPASNKVYTIPGVSVMECVDGKIKHNADYWDMATAMRQLGFLPAPK
jgi:steroid delta-isomerase-like uncharacterized protein